MLSLYIVKQAGPSICLYDIAAKIVTTIINKNNFEENNNKAKRIPADLVSSAQTY